MPCYLVQPMLYNYSKIYLPYCDGSSRVLQRDYYQSLAPCTCACSRFLHAGGSQTGDVSAPIAVGNETIYYRGHRILQAMIPYVLANEGVASASDVVSLRRGGGQF